MEFWNILAAAPHNSHYWRFAIKAGLQSPRMFTTERDPRVRKCVIKSTHLTSVQMTSTQLLPPLLTTCSGKNLSVNPRTCPSEGASLFLYTPWFARPASVHPKTIFRLALSNRCVQALLRSRRGTHSLPCIIGHVTNIPRAQRVCTLCQTGKQGDEQHLVFECLART